MIRGQMFKIQFLLDPASPCHKKSETENNSEKVLLVAELLYTHNVYVYIQKSICRPIQTCLKLVCMHVVLTIGMFVYVFAIVYIIAG